MAKDQKDDQPAGPGAGASELQRMAALFAWRLPDTGGGSAFAVLGGFAAELQAAFSKAAAEQAGSLLAANERLSELSRRLAQCRDPAALLPLQVEIIERLADAGFANVAIWAELVERVQAASTKLGLDAATRIPPSQAG
jgi:hypothetical protein